MAVDWVASSAPLGVAVDAQAASNDGFIVSLFHTHTHTHTQTTHIPPAAPHP